MTKPIQPMTYFDGKELATFVELAVTRAYTEAAAWRVAVPPAPLTEHEGKPIVRKGEAAMPVPPFDPAAPRYTPEAINAELAMILYRLACRFGLHATGIEAGLLQHIERLEGRLAALGVEIVRGQAAAEALTAQPENVFR